MPMSPGDRAHRQALQDWKAERLAPPAATASWWGRANDWVTGTADLAGHALAQVPGAARVGRAPIPQRRGLRLPADPPPRPRCSPGAACPGPADLSH